MILLVEHNECRKSCRVCTFPFAESFSEFGDSSTIIKIKNMIIFKVFLLVINLTCGCGYFFLRCCHRNTGVGLLILLCSPSSLTFYSTFLLIQAGTSTKIPPDLSAKYFFIFRYISQVMSFLHTKKVKGRLRIFLRFQSYFWTLYLNCHAVGAH